MQVVPGTQLFLRAHGKYGFSVEQNVVLAEEDPQADSQVTKLMCQLAQASACLGDNGLIIGSI